MNTPDQQGSGSSPLDDFSGCHEGIIENFKQMLQLLELTRQSASSKEIKAGARQLLKFFDDIVLTHHAEEEQELFTAVMDAAADESEASRARGQIKRLVAEHRDLEAMWKQIEPDLKKLARGKPADGLDRETAAKLARDYLAHAEFEEREFLPMAAEILSKNDLSALGLSLHMRHQESAGNYYI